VRHETDKKGRVPLGRERKMHKYFSVAEKSQKKKNDERGIMRAKEPKQAT